MGKKSKSQSDKTAESGKPNAAESNSTGIPFLGGNAHVDPNLASLFEKSVCVQS